MHNLLQRQMTRSGVNKDQSPSLEQWKAFLSRVERSYTEADQDRYLIERSMEISSREMRELNKKLEYVQHIASLGYWQYDVSTQKMMWSKEMYSIFDVNPTESIPSYDQLLECIHTNDREVIKNMIAESFVNKTSFEFQIEITTFKNQKKWCYFSGKPTLDSDQHHVRFVTGIAHDITSRKNTELEIHQYQQFLTSARRAGMLEVAVSVLHNVGNILNSINVSVEFIQDSFQKSEIHNVIKVIHLLNAHAGELDTYLTQDNQGKLLPQYLVQVENVLKNWDHEILSELFHLKDNITHLKEIVALQGTISGISGNPERISLNDILDLAFNISHGNLSKCNILLEKNYCDNLEIIVDKNKIIQILVNLLQNAKESLQTSLSEKNKKIIITTRLNNQHIEIEVFDNGIGISPENMKKIFEFGFTTKTTGHGFGLHSSFLIAKELGGELQVRSDGEDLGASFTLLLPLKEVHHEGRKHGQ